MLGETALDIFRTMFEGYDVIITDDDGQVMAEGYVNAVLESDNVSPQIEFYFEDGQTYDLNLFNDIITRK